MTGKRGGPGRGQGRKPLSPDGQSISLTIRLASARQKAKLRTLGGGRWIRDQIDAAQLDAANDSYCERCECLVTAIHDGGDALCPRCKLVL